MLRDTDFGSPAEFTQLTLGIVNQFEITGLYSDITYEVQILTTNIFKGATLSGNFSAISTNNTLQDGKPLSPPCPSRSI